MVNLLPNKAPSTNTAQCQQQHAIEQQQQQQQQQQQRQEEEQEQQQLRLHQEQNREQQIEQDCAHQQALAATVQQVEQFRQGMASQPNLSRSQVIPMRLERAFKSLNKEQTRIAEDDMMYLRPPSSKPTCKN